MWCILVVHSDLAVSYHVTVAYKTARRVNKDEGWRRRLRDVSEKHCLRNVVQVIKLPCVNEEAIVDGVSS